jgi:hypothetical protein
MLNFYRLLQRLVVALLLVVIVPHWANATMYKARIDVMVDSTETVVFKFASDIGTEVPISMFSVVSEKNGEYNYQKPEWFLAISPGTYKRISEIRYGQAVDGFPENEAKHLVEGKRYLASIEGAGISESIEFELMRCSGKLAVRVLKAR